MAALREDLSAANRATDEATAAADAEKAAQHETHTSELTALRDELAASQRRNLEQLSLFAKLQATIAQLEAAQQEQAYVLVMYSRVHRGAVLS